MQHQTSLFRGQPDDEAVKMKPATVRGYISRGQAAWGYRFGKVETEE